MGKAKPPSLATRWRQRPTVGYPQGSWRPGWGRRELCGSPRAWCLLPHSHVLPAPDTRQPGAGRQAWAAAEGQPAWPPTSPLLPGPGWAGLAQPSRVWPQVCQRPCWLLAWAPCCPSPSSAGGLTRGGPHLCWDLTPLLGTEARQSLSAPAQTPLGKPAPGPVGRKLQLSRGVPPCTPLPAQPWPCCRGDQPQHRGCLFILKAGDWPAA